MRSSGHNFQPLMYMQGGSHFSCRSYTSSHVHRTAPNVSNVANCFTLYGDLYEALRSGRLGSYPKLFERSTAFFCLVTCRHYTKSPRVLGMATVFVAQRCRGNLEFLCAWQAGFAFLCKDMFCYSCCLARS